MKVQERCRVAHAVDRAARFEHYVAALARVAEFFRRHREHRAIGQGQVAAGDQRNPATRLARAINNAGQRDVARIGRQRIVSHARGARHRHVAGTHAQVALLEKSGVVEIGPQGIEIGHRPRIKGEAPARAPRAGRAVQGAGDVEDATRRTHVEIPGITAISMRTYGNIAARQQSYATPTRGQINRPAICVAGDIEELPRLTLGGQTSGNVNVPGGCGDGQHARGKQDIGGQVDRCTLQAHAHTQAGCHHRAPDTVENKIPRGGDVIDRTLTSDQRRGLQQRFSADRERAVGVGRNAAQDRCGDIVITTNGKLSRSQQESGTEDGQISRGDRGRGKADHLGVWPGQINVTSLNGRTRCAITVAAQPGGEQLDAGQFRGAQSATAVEVDRTIAKETKDIRLGCALEQCAPENDMAGHGAAGQRRITSVEQNADLTAAER